MVVLVVLAVVFSGEWQATTATGTKKQTARTTKTITRTTKIKQKQVQTDRSLTVVFLDVSALVDKIGVC